MFWYSQFVACISGLTLLLATIHSVFVQLIIIHFFSVSFTALSRRFCSSVSVSAISTVSPVFFIMLTLLFTINNPGRISSSLRIVSLYSLNKSGVWKHASLTPLSNLLNSFIIRKHIVWPRYTFWIILTYFQNLNYLKTGDFVRNKEK